MMSYFLSAGNNNNNGTSKNVAEILMKISQTDDDKENINISFRK